METYLDWVTEEAFWQMLWPLYTPITGEAMRAFGQDELMSAAIVDATVGAIGAVMLLYVTGRLLGLFMARYLSERYQYLHENIAGILPFLGFAIMSPAGFLIALSFGAFHAKLWLTLPISLFVIYVDHAQYWSPPL